MVHLFVSINPPLIGGENCQDSRKGARGQDGQWPQDYTAQGKWPQAPDVCPESGTGPVQASARHSAEGE